VKVPAHQFLDDPAGVIGFLGGVRCFNGNNRVWRNCHSLHAILHICLNSVAEARAI